MSVRRRAQVRLSNAVPIPNPSPLRLVPATVTAVSAGGDVSVDFGDGVGVPCPRGAGCPTLTVGEIVQVFRQDHGNTIWGPTTALTGS